MCLKETLCNPLECVLSYKCRCRFVIINDALVQRPVLVQPWQLFSFGYDGCNKPVSSFPTEQQQMILPLLLILSTVLAVPPSLDFYVNVPADVERVPSSFEVSPLTARSLLQRGAERTYVDTISAHSLRQIFIDAPSKCLASDLSFEDRTVTIFKQVAFGEPFTIARTYLTNRNDNFVFNPITPVTDIPNAYHSALYLDPVINLERLLFASSYYDIKKVIVQDLPTRIPPPSNEPVFSRIVDVKDAHQVGISDRWVVVEPEHPYGDSETGSTIGSEEVLEQKNDTNSLLPPVTKLLWVIERGLNLDHRVLPITSSPEPISTIVFADSNTLLVKAGSSVNIVDAQTFIQQLIKLEDIVGQAEVGWDGSNDELLVLYRYHDSYKLRRYNWGGEVVGDVKVADANEGCPEWERFYLASNATAITRLQAPCGDNDFIKLTVYTLE